MSEAVTYVVFCRECNDITEIETVPTEWLNGKATAWEHRCAKCGNVFGIMLDCGELDLGLVKAQSTDTELNVGDFEVFTKIPWEY